MTTIAKSNPTARPLPRIRFCRPLVDLAATAAALDLDREHAVALIEDGRLEWAWNMARRGSKARTIRVLAASIETLQRHRSNPSRTGESDWEYVFGLILPGGQVRPGIVAKTSTIELAGRFMLDGSFVHQLLRDGEFEPIKGTRCRRGRHGSPEVTIASVQSFLKRRRIA